MLLMLRKHFEMAERVRLIICYLYKRQNDNMKQFLLLVSLFKKPQTPKKSFNCVFLSFKKKKKSINSVSTMNSFWRKPQFSRDIMQKEETDISAE